MKQGLTAACALLAITFVAMIGMSGCGGGGTETLSSERGTVNVHMADGSDSGVTSMVIVVDKVQANVNGQWVVVQENDVTIDLLTLTQNSMLLASNAIPVGHYKQVRLFVSSATVVDASGTHNVVIPSGAQTGIKVNLDFDVNAEVVTDLLLDFNVCESLVRQGNGTYHLKPVIRGVIRALSGTIKGSASNGANVLLGVQVKAIYTAGTSYPIGTEVNSTATLADGQFKIWALLPGTYRVELTWTDPITTSIVLTAAVDGVVVTANQDTDIGVVVLL